MLLCMLVALLLPQKLSMCGVGRVFFVARCVYVSLRCVDLDCRMIVFRRQFTSSVYFLHATPPGLCHCRLIAWLVELILFYHSMVAASRRLCNMFAFCRCYCPGLLGSLALCALCARPLACSCLYQSSPPELENSPLLLCRRRWASRLGWWDH